MEYIVERIQGHFGQLRSDLNGLTQTGSLPQKQATIALKKMIRTIAQLFVESDEPKAWVQLIMREQAKPTEAFDIIYEGQMKHVQRMLSTLIATCIGLSPESDEVKIRCHALVGQILIFTLSRESLLRHLNVKKLTTEHIEKIYSILIEHAESCLVIKMSERP
ncbi:MAG: DUF1956 domain-containing protein [Gammaproteobacteria bacterium]|nr:DUF1956 domain-containing protein [Gammaproteobacteria bacterium]